MRSRAALAREDRGTLASASSASLRCVPQRCMKIAHRNAISTEELLTLGSKGVLLPLVLLVDDVLQPLSELSLGKSLYDRLAITR